VSLEGPAWALSAQPALGSPLDGIVVTARFEDGMMSGESGCNTYTTSYEVDGTSLAIGPEIARTSKACPRQRPRWNVHISNDCLRSRRIGSLTAPSPC
jgi:heat shock protein HslJ